MGEGKRVASGRRKPCAGRAAKMSRISISRSEIYRVHYFEQKRVSSADVNALGVREESRKAFGQGVVTAPEI
jgi:hypothetical protein